MPCLLKKKSILICRTKGNILNEILVIWPLKHIAFLATFQLFRPELEPLPASSCTVRIGTVTVNRTYWPKLEHTYTSHLCTSIEIFGPCRSMQVTLLVFNGIRPSTPINTYQCLKVSASTGQRTKVLTLFFVKQSAFSNVRFKRF